MCAAFGAGLSSACVVDVGDEKSHVCCVEDGVSNPFTRLTLNVGGSDITRLFYGLLGEVNIVLVCVCRCVCVRPLYVRRVFVCVCMYLHVSVCPFCVVCMCMCVLYM